MAVPADRQADEEEAELASRFDSDMAHVDAAEVDKQAGDKADDRPSTPPPPPPALENQSRLEHIVQPGAYRVAPGNPYGNLDSSEETDDEEPEVRSSVRQFRGSSDLGEEYLIEADLVQEPTEVRTTELLSTMLVEAKPLRRWNRWMSMGLGALLILAIVVGVSLGVVLPNNLREPTSSAQSPFALSAQPSALPSSNPSIRPSLVPTWTPSVSPSTMPSSMPTRMVLMTLRDSLPIFTIEQLSNASTSQSLALKWIATTDRPRSNLRRITQRFILATIYYATSGATTWKRDDGWLNSTVNECNWLGCNCTENGTIRGLVLEYYRLVGTIPKEVSLLEDLVILQIRGNRGLRGTLPREIGQLTALRNVEMVETRISGRLPTEIGRLTRLETLYLGDSLISGTISTEIGLLRSLAELDLYGTRIFGPVPSSLGSLSTLTFLDLSFNQLSSTIPEEVGNMSSLVFINLEDNLLTGPLPSTLFYATALDALYLSTNSLTGSIPTSIGQALRLSDISVEENDLTGTIPTELGLLFSLTRLFLYDNQLNGTIPTELGILTNLKDKGLSLDQNELTGTLPTELGLLSNVDNMDFYQNQLRGSVPTQLCALVSTGLDLELECGAVNCSCECNCWYPNATEL